MIKRCYTSDLDGVQLVGDGAARPQGAPAGDGGAARVGEDLPLGGEGHGGDLAAMRGGGESRNLIGRHLLRRVQSYV